MSTRAGGAACVQVRSAQSSWGHGRSGAPLGLTVIGREPTERATDFSSWWLGERDHEASILMSRTGAVARYRGERRRAKTSMTNMRQAQHGHGRSYRHAVANPTTMHFARLRIDQMH